MISIKLGKRKYKGIYSWSDLTLQKFCDLAAIPIPEGYEAFILADGKYDFEQKESVEKYVDTVLNLTEKQVNEDFPAYYRKVIACLTNIPVPTLLQAPNNEVEKFYNDYFAPFVLSLLYHIPVIRFAGHIVEYTPEIRKSFRLNHSKFYLPKSIVITGQEVPLANEPIITYTEASDFFRGMRISKEDVERLKYFMGIYCRKKNEKYDEKNVLERQELFMNSPMSIVWSVFFYIIRRLPDFGLIIPLFGRLPKTVAEIVSEVKDSRNLVIAG